MYRIEIAPGAMRFLDRLAKTRKNIVDHIKEAIDSLQKDPFKGKKLIGELSHFHSLRVGDYWILYSIIQQQILIQVIKIGHCGEIYR